MIKSINKIRSSVDNCEKKQKHSVRFYLIIISGFILGFVGISMILIGFFNVNPSFFGRKTGMVSNIDDLSPVGDIEPEAYIYWYAPPNSFGIRETKTVNWSYFKQLFNSHTDWILEYKRYENSEWTEGNQYLTINKTWNTSGGFWKISLEFDVPIDIYSARFTFGCDLVVLDYVEREGYEVWLNYSANATENYSVMFNWSDIASIPGLVITHITVVHGVHGEL